MAIPTSGDYSDVFDADCSVRIVVCCVFIIVAASSLLILRIYARSITDAAWGLDDFVLPAAWALCVVQAICTGFMVRSTDVEQHGTVQILLYAGEMLRAPSNAASRCSILLLYLRVFRHQKHTQRCAKVIIACTLLQCVALEVWTSMQCVPLQYLWDITVSHGWCSGPAARIYFTVLPDVIMDLAILALPLPAIWRLNASVQRRWGLSAVCATSNIGAVAAVARTVLVSTQQQGPGGSAAPVDVPQLICAVAQSGLYFFAACLIGFRPLFVRLSTWVRTAATHADTAAEVAARSVAQGCDDCEKGGAPVKMDSGSGRLRLMEAWRERKDVEDAPRSVRGKPETVTAFAVRAHAEYRPDESRRASQTKGNLGGSWECNRL